MLHQRRFQRELGCSCGFLFLRGACGRVLDATVSAGRFGLATRLSSPKSVASGTQPQAPARFPFRGKLLSREARSHTGFTLVELIVAMILLGAVMTTVVPLLGWVNVQRRAADARLFAVQETANILERFTIREWEKLTQESADTIGISDQTAQWLKEPSLKVTVQERDSQLPSRRITVELSWINRAGDRATPARLTSFVYRKSKSD